MSNRELLPGEEFYSVVTEENGVVGRTDIAAECWTEPPQNCLAWWKSTVLKNSEKKNSPLSAESLLQIFDELTFQPESNDVRYILTLMLLRRRIFKLESEMKDDGGNKVMLVSTADGSETYQVPVAMPGQDRFEEIQRIIEQR